MILNVTQELKQLNGSPMMDAGADGTTCNATLRTALVNALMAPKDKDKGTEKMRKYDLAMRIYKNDSVDIEAADVAMLKELVGEAFAPLVVGQVWNALEGR